MFLLPRRSKSDGNIISNERLLALAGVKVEQLQEKEDEKEQERLRGGVLLWTEEDHPLVSHAPSIH